MLSFVCVATAVYSGFLCFGRLIRGQPVKSLTITLFAVSTAALAYSAGWIH